MKNVQDWINETFSEEEKNELGELIIPNKKLQNSLSLHDFLELKKLDCSNNKIITLELSNCEELAWLDCSKNRICELNLPFRLAHLNCHRNSLTDLCFLEQEKGQINPTVLTYLDISDNKLFNSKLICFEHFTGLELLKINSSDVNRKGGEIYKHLYNYLKKCELEGRQINLIEMNEWKEEHLKLTNAKSTEKKLIEQRESFLSWISQPLGYLRLNIEEATRLLFWNNSSHEERFIQTVTNVNINAPINVNQGNALLGNTIGDQTNLSYHTGLIALSSQEQQQAQVQQPNLPFNPNN